nr:unnamed protein product [Digitaria exilis]
MRVSTPSTPVPRPIVQINRLGRRGPGWPAGGRRVRVAGAPRVIRYDPIRRNRVSTFLPCPTGWGGVGWGVRFACDQVSRWGLGSCGHWRRGC